MSRRDPSAGGPDIAVLVAMIAFACLATMGELALVVTAPTWVVWLAALLPVIFWAILLRQVHRFLRDGEPADAPSWTASARRFVDRHRRRRRDESGAGAATSGAEATAAPGSITDDR